jgi:pimeloyl-ACP methyl ester carboxylesterase
MGRVAQLAGLDMAYRESGAAAPLLLIHGFPLDGEMWSPQLRAFGTSRRVVAPDLAGFGKTGGTGRKTLDAHADDLAALLDHLGIPRAVVVGLSMGGYIAFSFWRRHRGRVAALVLADTRPGADGDEARAQRRALAEKVMAEGPEVAAASLRGRYISADAPAEIEAEVRTMILRQGREGIASALEALAGRADSTGDLAGIDVPVLIAVGASDAITPPHESEAMLAAIPGARLALIPRAGHLSNLEEPGAFNGALREFLNEIDEAAAGRGATGGAGADPLTASSGG